MDDPIMNYEMCPKCGQYTDGKCCEIDFEWFDFVIDELDRHLTWTDLSMEQRKELTDASNALCRFRSITQKYYT